MPDMGGSTGCSTPVGYRSSGDVPKRPSPAGPMSCRRNQSTSLLLASTYLTAAPVRQSMPGTARVARSLPLRNGGDVMPSVIRGKRHPVWTCGGR